MTARTTTISFCFILSCLGSSDRTYAQSLTGRVVDEAGKLLPARLYIRSENGRWYHAESVSPKGSAVAYSRIRDESQEVHTTLSAHPFQAELPAGKYSLTVERGKEYHTLNKEIEIRSEDKRPVDVELKLRRWTNMAARGWYSGDTHVHRTLADLPNVVLAEDLNVALPLTYWVTDSLETPARNNKNREAIPPAKLIRVDDTHVIWPINTEYEIFSVRRKRHTLGALFILNHARPLTHAAPTVTPIVAEARSQNGDVLLDLDKHNWPWSMMLPPVAKVDLFELTNNHIWRTEFRFRDWYAEYAADYMQLKMRSDGGFTERGWIDFGFQNYYALLNCGFAMQPTAGTASGVHPVPLGFGRVYIHLEDGFDYHRWIDGLKLGRSFVTTGPMLTAFFNGKDHGAIFDFDGKESATIEIAGVAESVHPLQGIEVIVNGRVAQTIDPQPEKTELGGLRFRFKTKVSIERSAWIALRCFEDRPDGRPRFAHTSPIRINIQGKPLKPRAEEVHYLIKRVQNEITRHQGVLSGEALAEFEKALNAYRTMLQVK